MSAIVRILSDSGTSCPNYYVMKQRPYVGESICWNLGKQLFYGRVVKVEKLDPRYFDFFKITVSNITMHRE